MGCGTFADATPGLMSAGDQSQSPRLELSGWWHLPLELRHVCRTAILTTTVGLPYNQACSLGRKKSKD